MNKIEQTPLIEVRGLKKYFKKSGKTLHAVDDINLSIMPGTTLGVVGESGCGKSTLGRTILRLIKPTEGQILFEGEDITKVSEAQMRKYRQSMQIIFQDPYSSLNPRKSVAEIIATPLVVNHVCKNKAELRKRVKELMDKVGLDVASVSASPEHWPSIRSSSSATSRSQRWTFPSRPRSSTC